MPVPPRTSGAQILATDVPAMFDATRTRVNAMQPRHMQPGALGPQHLPSLVRARDQVRFTTPITVNTSPATLEIAANIVATWQDPAALYVNNGGAGYVIPGGALLFTFATLHMGSFAGAFDVDHQVWANLYTVIGGTDQTDVANNRMIYGQVSTAGDDLTTNDTITIYRWTRHTSAFTLNRVGVRFALNRGGSAGAVPNFTVDNGVVGFVAFYQDA